MKGFGEFDILLKLSWSHKPKSCPKHNYRPSFTHGYMLEHSGKSSHSKCWLNWTYLDFQTSYENGSLLFGNIIKIHWHLVLSNCNGSWIKLGKVPQSFIKEYPIIRLTTSEIFGENSTYPKLYESGFFCSKAQCPISQVSSKLSLSAHIVLASTWVNQFQYGVFNKCPSSKTSLSDL